VLTPIGVGVVPAKEASVLIGVVQGAGKEAPHYDSKGAGILAGKDADNNRSKHT
jgi:hypothetical protein